MHRYNMYAKIYIKNMECMVCYLHPSHISFAFYIHNTKTNMFLRPVDIIIMYIYIYTYIHTYIYSYISL